MDMNRTDQLAALGRDAGLERSDFLVQATDQLDRFLKTNKRRLEALGGLVLIDEDPDYLAIAPDLTFRSRTRYEDETSGEWVSETEVIESAGELVEIYNPADIYAAFIEAARVASGLPEEPTAAEELMEVAGVAVSETVEVSEGSAIAGAPLEMSDEEHAARRLYDLALSFQERSQQSEAGLLDDWARQASVIAPNLGDFVVTDDDDERLTLTRNGFFTAEVLPEDTDGEWRQLDSSEQLVEFYDPTDVFGDLADALAEAFPAIAPEFEGEEDEGEEDEEDDDEARSGAPDRA